MKALTKPIALALVAVAALLTTGTVASAQDHKRVHRLARVIEQHAKELHEELDDHFKPSLTYKTLNRNAREIEQLARTVYQITDAGNRKGLRQAVERLEDEVRQFATLALDARRFDKISPQAYAHVRREARYLQEAVRDMRLELHD